MTLFDFNINDKDQREIYVELMKWCGAWQMSLWKTSCCQRLCPPAVAIRVCTSRHPHVRSVALLCLSRWIAEFDFDAFRLDAVPHVTTAYVAYFSTYIRE